MSTAPAAGTTLRGNPPGVRLPPKAVRAAGPPRTRLRRMDQSREAHHTAWPLPSPEGAEASRWLTPPLLPHMVGTSVGAPCHPRSFRRRQRQNRKLLERGLVGCPTRGWVAARAASRCVRISGMTCSVLPIRDCQPHSQLAWRWPLSARPAGLTVTLCPATCSLTEMVTGHLRSVRDGRTYPLGEPVAKLSARLWVSSLHRSQLSGAPT
jgi:hypothetical protein